MILIFGTTNERKMEDLRKIILSESLDIEVKSLKDIGWNLGEIEETGTTLEENSLIKAKSIYEFCKGTDIREKIITDDGGLFVEYLNGEPGVKTARYAEEELKENKDLPKYECVNKLLRNMIGADNRNAYYRCVVTLMDENGDYIQESNISNGYISERIIGQLKRPYFYSVFCLEGYDKSFDMLNYEELKDTYRVKTLTKVLKEIKK